MSTEAPVTAPTKVCRNCAAQAQTLAKKCPHCGKKYKRRTLLKVVLGLCVLFALGIGGCAALIGGAANEVAKQLDSEQRAHAISADQFHSLSLGMSEKAVIAQVGKRPEDRQEFDSESFLNDEPDHSSCIYYNRAGGSFGDTFQLCFDNGKLTSRNAY